MTASLAHLSAEHASTSSLQRVREQLSQGLRAFCTIAMLRCTELWEESTIHKLGDHRTRLQKRKRKERSSKE